MTTVSEMQTAVDKSLVNMDRLDRVVNGDATTVVTTDGGLVKSVAKWQADLIAEVEAGLSTATIDTIVGLRGYLNKVAPVIPEDYGAVGDRIANDTTAINAALVVAQTENRPLLLRGRYLCDTLNIPDEVVVYGANKARGDISPGASMYGFSSQICLTSGSTIYTGRSSVMDGLVVTLNGLQDPVTTNSQATTLKGQFSGTAISIAYRDAVVSNLLILGFNTGIDATAANGNEGRPVIMDCRIDANNPVKISGWYDIPRVARVHAWPFLTAHVTGLANVNLCRDGTGFYIAAVSDWTTLHDCFSYGHRKAFVADTTASNVGFIRCQADHSGTISETDAGFTIMGSAMYSLMVGCTAIAHKKSLVVDTTAVRPARVIGCVFAPQEVGIDCVNGSLLASGNLIDAGATGVQVSSTFTKAQFSTMEISSGTQYSINETAAPNVTIDGATTLLTFTPTVTAEAGSITTASASMTYQIERIGNRTRVKGRVSATITNNGTGATSVRISLPLAPSESAIAIGRRDGVGGNVLQFSFNTGVGFCSVYNADNSYPGADGAVLASNFEYWA